MSKKGKQEMASQQGSVWNNKLLLYTGLFLTLGLLASHQFITRQVLVNDLDDDNDQVVGNENNVENIKDEDTEERKLQHFLNPNQCASLTTVLRGTNTRHTLISITDVMVMEEGITETSSNRMENRVFLMLNGQNEGLYVSWEGETDCLFDLAKVGAVALGADLDWLQNGLRLFSPLGEAIRNAADLESANRRAHLLMDRQLWIWPGIRIGYKYKLKDNVTMTTIGMKPKVFDVEGFFSDADTTQILELGTPELAPSLVMGENQTGIAQNTRTSHSVFLDDGKFVQQLKKRSTEIVRLPFADCAERLQFVRYNAGEFYRKHMDIFFGKTDILPQETSHGLTFQDYVDWANWASAKINAMEISSIPMRFRPGETLFPVSDDPVDFQNALLKIFITWAEKTNFFVAYNCDHWTDYLNTNVANQVPQLIEAIANPTGKVNFMLKFIIREWERQVGLVELKYTFGKSSSRPSGVSYYSHWTSWIKDIITRESLHLPSVVLQTGGEWYPKMDSRFQVKMLDLILEDLPSSVLIQATNLDWYNWMVENQGRKDVLLVLIKNFPTFVELVIRAWEHKTRIPLMFQYRFPTFVPPTFPQRFATLFLYLNDVDEGGETVFPYSPEQHLKPAVDVNGVEDEECSTGLAVPPRKLHASLFYHLDAEMEIEWWSRHGGCPPANGTKWGSNSFMWNSDAVEGASAYGW